MGSELIVQVKNNINLENAAKTVVKFNLDKINSREGKLGRNIKDEKEVFITRPVKILHPTDLILLPIIERAQNSQIDS
jgi:hypothetical protein